MNIKTKPARDRMPSNKNALIRVITMLRHIPKHPRQITVKELIERLQSANFEVSKRTVERDLISLSTTFSLITNERSRPYGWSWSKDAAPQYEEVKSIIAKMRNIKTDFPDEEATDIDYSIFCFSDQLIAETRNVLYEMPMTPDDHIHLRNHEGSWGKISILDLMNNNMLIKDKRTGGDYQFESIDELIEAGWVLD